MMRLAPTPKFRRVAGRNEWRGRATLAPAPQKAMRRHVTSLGISTKGWSKKVASVSLAFRHHPRRCAYLCKFRQIRPIVWNGLGQFVLQIALAVLDDFVAGHVGDYLTVLAAGIGRSGELLSAVWAARPP